MILTKVSDLNYLRGVLEEAAHLLPAQGPLSVFVHHNTLHALEELPFEDAVVQASRILHTEPFMPETWYRREYRRGRILDRDLVEVVRANTPRGQLVAGVVSRRDLYRGLLLHELVELDGQALAWHLAETPALLRFRPEVDRSIRHRMEIETLAWLRTQAFEEQWEVAKPERSLIRSGEDVAVHALWTVCQAAVARLFPHEEPPEAPSRHRETLLRTDRVDPDSIVHPTLIRWSAAYLDQGVADLAMPGRENGFYLCLRQLYSRSGNLLPEWMRGLPARLRDEAARGLAAEDSVLESLNRLGVPQPDWSRFVRDTLLALKGWAGMFHQAEIRPDRLPIDPIPARLVDFLAVRLLLDAEAVTFAAQGEDVASLVGPGARSVSSGSSALARAHLLFQVAQFTGLSTGAVNSWTSAQLTELFEELGHFNEVARRRLFHLAYERRLKVVTLDAVTLHPRTPEFTQPPEFQAVFCIDEREESTRRYLEEIAPNCQTFSVAGFFGVPMYFQAVTEPRPVALCPVVIRPRHLVVEVPNEASREEAERLTTLRRSLGHVAQSVQVGSQTLTWGSLLTSGLGVFTALPHLLRILFPRTAGKLGRNFKKRLRPSETRFVLEHTGQDPVDGLQVGFTIEEMTRSVTTVLQDIGLTRNFSALVLIIGHGSSSLNNPHESAYDCGACGGGRGGPNARAFAWMANHPAVREGLKKNGIHVPDGTRFVGAFHNTCDDDVDLYDLADLTEEQVVRLEGAAKVINEARARDAMERCRRFMSASTRLSPLTALAHVESRSEDLAQPRPECGHATNAICIVGRRTRTRGLFLDRRAFLQSYDPTQDDEEGTILGRILRAVVPVGSGINLEYFFSYVDNQGYGAGTKLPHNITGLLGVMDGNSSDLRTGLPWQMVEIHEPVRLLSVIESTPAVIARIMEREPAVKQLVLNRWTHVALLDPHSQRIQVLENGTWVPYESEAQRLPLVTSSTDWFHQHREHLFFAEIRQPNGKVHEVTGAGR